MNGDSNVNPDLVPLSIVPPIDGAMMDLDASSGHAPNPMHRMHSALRGRYGIAIVLALLGMAIGAVLGYMLTHPVYQSVGQIQIKAILPTVMGNNQADMMPMFDAYMDGQAQMMGNTEVISEAMANHDWIATAPKSEVTDVANFENNLLITHDKSSEVIVVAFESTSAKAAQAAVAAVIKAYMNIYGNTETTDETNKENALRQIRDQQNSTKDDLVKELNSNLAKYGPNYEEVYQLKFSEVQAIQKDLDQAQQDLSNAQIATTRPSDITEAKLEAMFPAVASLKNRLDIMQAQLDGLRAGGMGEENPQYKNLRQQVDSTRQNLSATEDNDRQLIPGGASDPDTIAKLTTRVGDITTKKDQLNAELQSIAQVRSNILDDRAKLDSIQRDIDDTQKSLQALQANAGLAVDGRIRKLSEGSVPDMPLKDRRIAVASGAGIALGGLFFGLVLCIGLVDSRVRHIDDVSSAFASRARVLGVLPYLPEDLSDPLQVANAAQAVHQIRTMLQRRRGTGDKTVICITSANPGVGKTSLSVALGLSFAASGSKTLLIDCDIIGGGLTAKMKKIARRRLGHLLRREGRITTQQLLTAVNEVQRTGKRIGEVLVDLGFVSQADVDWALGLQQNTQVGLREAINGDPIGECIAYSGSPRLWVMPLGSAERRHAAQLTFSTLQRIIGQARNLFNVIIIDTGPICGSLEGPVAAMAADEVVLTVARGDHRPMIEQAIQLINSNGSNLAGLVLNRADADDIAAAAHSSSAARLSTGRPAISKPTNGHANGEAIRLGPVGTAVASLTDTRIDPSSHVEDSQ